MQGVTELMQEGAYLTWREQGGTIGCGLGEVHHQHDVRTMIFTLGRVILLLQVIHPGTALLALTREEVGVEKPEIAPIGIVHLVGVYVAVVDGQIRALGEADTVEACCQREDGIRDAR